MTDADEIITRNSDIVLAMLRTSVHRDSLLSIHQYNPHEEISVTVISFMSLYIVSEKKLWGFGRPCLKIHKRHRFAFLHLNVPLLPSLLSCGYSTSYIYMDKIRDLFHVEARMSEAGEQVI